MLHLESFRRGASYLQACFVRCRGRPPFVNASEIARPRRVPKMHQLNVNVPKHVVSVEISGACLNYCQLLIQSLLLVPSPIQVLVDLIIIN